MRSLNTTLTVAKASLTATADPRSKTYGGADPLLTGALSGFIGSDNVTALFSRVAGENVGTAASMCKLYCSEMVGRVADRAVQIHGGMGLVRGYPIERFYRDVRHYRVGEGSSEIQRMLIARDLLK